MCKLRQHIPTPPSRIAKLAFAGQEFPSRILTKRVLLVFWRGGVWCIFLAACPSSRQRETRITVDFEADELRLKE